MGLLLQSVRAYTSSAPESVAVSLTFMVLGLMLLGVPLRWVALLTLATVALMMARA